MTSQHPQAVRRVQAIKAALADGILNAHQISERIFLCLARTEDYLAELKAEGAIHIKRYSPPASGKQQPIAHYALGKGRNAPKPRPMSNNRKSALARARIYRDEDRHEAFKARGRAIKRARKAAKTPQTWLSALGAV